METFAATQSDNQGKIKTTLVMYRVTEGGVKYCFYAKLAKRFDFRASGGPVELDELIDSAIDEYPQERSFEYTGSHFVPLLDRSWASLHWEKFLPDGSPRSRGV